MTTSDNDERILLRDQHGTHSSYIQRKCRCDLCRKARADYVRRWRAARATGPRRVHNCPCCTCERPGGDN